MGSFYNVVIYRMPQGMGIAKGRSFCPSCRHDLSPLDLVPVLSFIFLKARCRYCHERISSRYPLVELLVGLLFLLAYMTYGLTLNMVYHILFWSMLVIVGLIDLDTMYILDSILVFFGIAMVIFAAINKLNLLDCFIGALIGGAVYLAIYLISKVAYKREAFGTGDILLMLLIGFFAGKRFALLASILPFYFAGLALIIAAFLKKNIKMQSELPFGPFICLSAWLISLYGPNIQEFILNLF